ncbi:MAG: hypothetical protein MZW92_43480 [Comamonadaceae bacterium]|nr:hypothetical protein [Comamonadaceae bacterium]
MSGIRAAQRRLPAGAAHALGGCHRLARGTAPAIDDEDRRRSRRARSGRPPTAARSASSTRRRLPHAFAHARARDPPMRVIAGDPQRCGVRGAPLIGVAGAYGAGAGACARDAGDAALAAPTGALDATRPTAVNLRWALDRVRAPCGARCRRASAPTRPGARPDAIADEDVAIEPRDRPRTALALLARAARSAGAAGAAC